MRHEYSALLLLTTLFSIGCSTPKIVSKNNRFYSAERKNDGGVVVDVQEYKADRNFKGEVIELSDYLTVKVKDSSVKFTPTGRKHRVDNLKENSYLSLLNKNYYPELFQTDWNAKSFIYYDIKFGLQALTVPLKFRRSQISDSLNPASVETGVNIGFAPGWKFTKNIYKQSKNYLGRNTTQVAIAAGPHFGFGAADLNNKTNSPGLISNRKRPTFTYGGFIMLGFNNINIGYAFGKDYVLGAGKDNWVYQGDTWTGIIVSLDILKF